MKSIIHTPTPDLEKSIEFYRKLDYKVLSKRDPVLLTDGKFILEINPDRFARAGMKMYRDNWDKILQRLDGKMSIHPTESGYLIGDPNGVWIYLENGNPPVEFNPEESSYGKTGNFQGISIESCEMQRSFEIWNILGFEQSMGDPAQGWVTLTNEDGMAVSLMKPLSCPHLFFNPSLTFFNGKKNMEVIDDILKAGIPITEEITYFNKEGIVDNIIIRDPGGYGFFIFSD